VWRYLAILSAARDFGVGRVERERVAHAFDPLTFDPDELAGALANVVLRRRAPLHNTAPGEIG
jgi:hypothetical protein